MAQLIVRRLEDELVAELRKRAARSRRSMEAEHREILRTALRPARAARSLKELWTGVSYLNAFDSAST